MSDGQRILRMRMEEGRGVGFRWTSGNRCYPRPARFKDTRHTSAVACGQPARAVGAVALVRLRSRGCCLLEQIAAPLLAFCLLGLTLAEGAGFDPTHDLLNRALKAHVQNALVDYAGLKAARSNLDGYLEAVAGVDEDTFKKWDEAQQIAFLINTYNAATLQLVIDCYPVASIKKIGTWLKGPWDQPVVRLWGGLATLNELEHKILRIRYDEPRVHFALVCAARGCPPLRSEAYVAPRLGEQLNDQARQFLADSSKNRVDGQTRTVYLSPIFKWYGEDFAKGNDSVLRALQSFWPESVSELAKDDFRVRYTDYDWALNDRDR